MNAVPFDTLKLARRLEAAGMSAPVAAGTSEALADAMAGGGFATKTDIAEVRQEIVELRSDMTLFRAEMKSEFAAVRSEMKNEFAAVRAEMKSALELLRRDMTIKLGSMLIIAVGVILAAFRFMPHPM